jgi:hypothetical protein
MFPLRGAIAKGSVARLFPLRKPAPLTCPGLIFMASKYFAIRPLDALNAAYFLYERGVISFPYTLCKVFPRNFDFGKVLGQLESWSDLEREIAAVRKTVQLLNENCCEKSLGFPIFPCAIPDFRMDRKSTEFMIFDLILRVFLGFLSTDAIVEETITELEISGELFKLKSRKIREYNWISICSFVGKENEDTGLRLAAGDEVEIESLRMDERNWVKEWRLWKECRMQEPLISKSVAELVRQGLVERDKEFVRPSQAGFSFCVGFDLDYEWLEKEFEKEFGLIDQGDSGAKGNVLRMCSAIVDGMRQNFEEIESAVC